MKAYVFETKITRRGVYVAESCTAIRAGGYQREPALYVRRFETGEDGRPAGDVSEAVVWTGGVMPTSPEELRELLQHDAWSSDQQTMDSVERVEQTATSRKNRKGKVS